MSKVLGIDVGGTGIKGAIVDTSTGEMITERIKYKTPQPATPEDMIDVMKKLVLDHEWFGGKIGVGFPSIIKKGISLSASNIDDSWLNFPVENRLNDALGAEVTVINDADAAGLAEQHFGKGKNIDGVLLFLTLGTGIGSALFKNGTLIPNTELGHLKWRDSIAEKYAGNKAREIDDLSWKDWGKEVNRVLNHIHFVISPDHILLGGGVSKKWENYKKYIKLNIPVEPASLLNNAGIIGAACAVVTKL